MVPKQPQPFLAEPFVHKRCVFNILYQIVENYADPRLNALLYSIAAFFEIIRFCWIVDELIL